MKRSSLPPRRSPMARSTALTRTALRRTRKARTEAETVARQLVAARSMGWCEGCLRAPATDWSHRKARSQGGPWCPSNGLALCRSDHAWAHANPAEARSVGWILRATDNPLTAPVLLPAGWVLLDSAGRCHPLPTERTA